MKRIDRVLVVLGTLLSVAVTLGLAGWQELQLARSETIYLELAPSDPRSLVQGDFMTLRWAVENDLQGLSAPGVAVVELDERGVAHFVRQHAGEPLSERERKLAFFPAEWPPVQVTSRAYLFQEGTAEVYDPARYGIVALSPEGKAALVGLAGADLKRLGPPPRRW